MPSDRLAGKVAIVTATGGGIGKAIARMFAREGACVYGCDINENEAQATLDEMRAEGHAFDSLHPCHLTAPGHAQGLIDRCVLRFGQIDILVNTTLPPDGTAEWPEAIDAASLLSRAAWPHLEINGAGSIITIASLTHAAGRVALTRQLAAEGGALNIRANAIAAGGEARTMIARPLHADDIAYCAAYLASDEAGWVTGVDIPIDGGASAW